LLAKIINNVVDEYLLNLNTYLLDIDSFNGYEPAAFFRQKKTIIGEIQDGSDSAFGF